MKECLDEKWYKIKAFMHCAEMQKYKMCMENDVRKKLEGEFGSLEKLSQDTNMDEKILLKLTSQILSDAMM